MVAYLLIAREQFATVALNGYIFVCGGLSNSATVIEKSVERYDPFANRWTTVTAMQIARNGPAAVAVNGLSMSWGEVSLMVFIPLPSNALLLVVVPIGSF